MLLELNIKTHRDLDKYREVLKTGQYLGVSITSKKTNLDLNIVLSELIKIPNLQIIPTFSCTANYDKDQMRTFAKFIDFVEILKKCHITNCLIVSGNPVQKLNTTSLLSLFELTKNKMNFGVAYNPYSLNLNKEHNRIIQKLSYTNVTAVYLQLGQDLGKLKTAVELIRSINPAIQIVNSILQPTKTLLQSLQFRPWSGVYYTDQFYNDLDFALQNVGQMHQLSQELDIKILISGV